MGFKKQYNDLTIFAFAFLDESFVLDVLVAGLTVVPSSENNIMNMITATNLKCNRQCHAFEN